MNYTADPVCHIRSLYDYNYYRRTSNWGGAYPRPFSEIITKSWEKSEQTKDWVDASE